MKIFIAKDRRMTITRHIVTVWFDQPPIEAEDGHWRLDTKKPIRQLRNHLSDEETGADLEPGEIREFDASLISPK